MMPNWKLKLTSRKFLMAIAAAGFVICTQGLDINIDSNTYWQVVTVVVGYIVGESIVDANRPSS
jgi:uncharacterized membrane protein